MRAVVALLVLLVAGCAAKLTPAGSLVRQVPAVASVRAECEFLGVVDVRESQGWDLADDRRGAFNGVRNRVAEMGGDAFILLADDSGLMGAVVQAEAYNCGTFENEPVSPFEIVQPGPTAE